LQQKIAKKITKNLYLGGSKSFKVIDVDTTKKHVTSAVLVMISSMSVPIRNRFHARQANSGKTTILEGVPRLDTRGRKPS